MPMLNSMTLATVSAAGQPSARIVLLKGVDARGFVFFTNYASRKGVDLAANPVAALLFHWVELNARCALRATSRKCRRANPTIIRQPPARQPARRDRLTPKRGRA